MEVNGMMIIAFLTGAFTFLFGVIVGATLVKDTIKSKEGNGVH